MLQATAGRPPPAGAITQQPGGAVMVAPVDPTGAAMILVDRGDPRACVFEQPKSDGSAWPLTLKSHPGFGITKKYSEERRAGPWRYTGEAP